MQRKLEFSTWLLTVASHILLAQIRQRGRGMLGDEALLTGDERTSGPETDPVQMAEIWERATWWDSILSTLTPIHSSFRSQHGSKGTPLVECGC